MKLIYSALLFLVSGATVLAQSEKETTLSDASINKRDGSLFVQFDGQVGQKVVKRDYRQILIPVLRNGTDSVAMPPIIIQGRKKRIITERQIRSGNYNNVYPDALYSSNGDEFEYTAAIPFQSWMNGSSLSVNTYEEGCCETDFLTTNVLARNLNFADPIVEEVVVITPAPQPVLASQTITLEFKVASSVIIEDFANNAIQLAQMRQLLGMQTSSDSPMKVDRIEIRGFASPEGSVEYNKRLAQSRAETLKQYILHHYPMIPASSIHIQNGVIDWDGLSKLVQASDMNEKQQVIDLINNTPHGEELTLKLKQINGGKTYKYMLENLYPRLRFVYGVDFFWINQEDITDTMELIE